MYQIIGKKRVDFVAKDTGKPIQGYSLYVAFAEDGIEGFKSEKMFISDYVVNKFSYSPEVGDKIEIFYDKNQRISRLEKVDS